MPISPHTFHIVTCDICPGDADDVLPLHDTADEAAADARRMGWIVTADQQVICHAADDAHRAAVDALLPPAPHIEVDGQLPLDFP
ncbi:hypothetical protein BX265_0858 [Streptomyces sp. TLI_235]|nr:hypothetical protein [Streptomyces sp. TLI_235]PBC76155.1 hypothetical protein BX265_0858 [Streptomyces sp. TLI_235]